jgi:hypothetical protein
LPSGASADREPPSLFDAIWPPRGRAAARRFAEAEADDSASRPVDDARSPAAEEAAAEPTVPDDDPFRVDQ